MNRRTFLCGLALGTLTVPLVAEAQSEGRVYRIGYLADFSPTTYPARNEGFRQGLRDNGYVEGRNIVIEYRYAHGKLERLPALAAELVRLNVELIHTSGDFAIRAAKEATTTIPIVVALGELLGPGYVSSLARPGGNITGLSTAQSELYQKRLELLKTAFPKVARVAFLWNPGNASNVVGLRETEAAARTLGVQLLPLEVRRFDDLEKAFQGALSGRAQALMALGDSVVLINRAQIVDFAAKNRLPAIYNNIDYMDVGGLMFYGSNAADMFRRSVAFVDKILKGAKPADLPIEQPTKFELVINMKTAKALGLTIPQLVLGRADQVIE